MFYIDKGGCVLIHLKTIRKEETISSVVFLSHNIKHDPPPSPPPPPQCRVTDENNIFCVESISLMSFQEHQEEVMVKTIITDAP